MTDIDAILTQIPADDPGGPDLRYDPVYDRIKELRREDDPRASRGIWLSKPKVADWTGAIQLCTEVLARRSKDLQLACWLADSMVARDGLDEIPPALHLVGVLSDAFWPVLWPRPSPDDEEDARRVVFDWLDSHLAERAMRTRIAAHGDIEVTWQDHISAQRRPPPPERPSPRRAVGETTDFDTAAIETAIERTGDTLYARLAQTVVVAKAALARLKGQLDHHYDGQGPSFSRTIAVLTAITTFLHPRLLRRGIELDAAPEPDRVTLPRGNDRSKPMREMLADDAATVMAGPIRSREEAYRTLEAAARFLEHTEPHSPVPLLIRRAVIWGRMPLSTLLPELMRDQPLLNRLLGLEDGAGEPVQAKR